ARGRSCRSTRRRHGPGSAPRRAVCTCRRAPSWSLRACFRVYQGRLSAATARMLGAPGANVTDSVVIIGGGPAGLAAGACLGERPVPFVVPDREGEPGGAYARMFPGIVLASPVAFSALPGLALPAGTEYVSAGEYAAYLRRYADHHRLSLTRATVDRVER